MVMMMKVVMVMVRMVVTMVTVMVMVRMVGMSFLARA